ncbi:MAG: helix-turn-helix transcriptional regulator [Clostridia bacterium]|nr:helix-turn-helix transcriptional regulator [Clostridia bacterium]
MDIYELNPHIRLKSRSVLNKGALSTPRALYDYELLYVEDGSFTLVYDGKPFFCKKGDIILIAPGVTHYFIINEEVSLPFVHFDAIKRTNCWEIPVSFKDLPDMTVEEKTWIHKKYFPHYDGEPILKCDNMERFLKLFNEVVSPTYMAMLVRKARLTELIAVIMHFNFLQFVRDHNDPSIEFQIKSYIDSNGCYNMTLQDFADFFSYNKFYMIRKFKSTFGIGIMEYRNKVKMEKANDLLIRFSLENTAKQLGFSSVYSFSRAYKDYFGKPPKSQIK